MKNNDWHEAYFDLVNKVECECVQQGDLVPIWDQFKAMSAELAKFKALAETLAGALKAYAEYCDICHGRGSIIEEDSATGADLWRDCPGCGPATEALREYKEARDAS